MECSETILGVTTGIDSGGSVEVAPTFPLITENMVRTSFLLYWPWH